jgi:hypothetical protein
LFAIVIGRINSALREYSVYYSMTKNHLINWPGSAIVHL